MKNLAGDLGVVTSARTKVTMISYFTQADKDLGDRLAKAVNVPVGDVNRAIAEYEASLDARYGGKQ